jgi:hypothetical protein
VFDRKDGKRVAGVLMVTLKLEDVNEWLKDVVMQDAFVTLFNSHKQVFEHRDMAKVRPMEVGKLPRSWDCPLYDQVLASQDGYTVFTDPVDQHQYLAGYAPVDIGSQRWGVLVQHEYDKVQQPMREVRSHESRWRIVSLIPTVLLILGLGGWVFIELRRRDEAREAA